MPPGGGVAARKDPDTGQLVDKYLSDEAWGTSRGSTYTGSG